MSNKTTITDIAQLAGCAPTTVSRFLNQSGYISSKTANNIENAIVELDYVPNQIARSLKNRKNNVIILIVPNITNPFYASFYRVVQSLSTSREFMVTLYDTNEKREEELKAIRMAIESNMSGIIFSSIDAHEIVIEGLIKSRIPTVVNFYEEGPFDSVHGKRNGSTHIAMQHLIDFGHRRIGFAGGTPGTRVAMSRRRGYVNALCENGIPVSDLLIFENEFTIESGKKAGEYFIGLRERPTAICCANDLIALGLITFMNDKGIVVPDEVSITGIDDIIYAQASSPPLTTVTSDPECFANETFKMLFERIDGIYKGKQRNTIINHSLVLRCSTKNIAE